MKTKRMIVAAFIMAFSTPVFANDKEMMREKFDMHDTNKDGTLSKSEWDATGEEMWMKADTNKDSQISFDEKMALHQKEKSMMKDHKKM